MRVRPAIVAVCLALCGSAQQLSLHEGVFRVDGLPQGLQEPAGGWATIFTVRAGDGDLPPMLGSYERGNSTLSFHPRFQLRPGVHYRAVFKSPGSRRVESSFEVARDAAAGAVHVERVYPSSATLPQNLLKFYVCFSGPMSRGEAWKHIRLVDSGGAQVQLPFLEIDQELWDPDQRRLTVLFDPGRIKRGVTPLEEAGPALLTGHTYNLVIDRDWRDGNGTPLERGYERRFRVSAPDRTPPDPALWTLKPPPAGAVSPLIVRFPEPMDFALLQHMLQVRGSSGPVDGIVAVGEDELEWRFTPKRAWVAGEYRLGVDNAIEDLAGNRVGRQFDVDTFERVTRRPEQDFTQLRFSVH